MTSNNLIYTGREYYHVDSLEDIIAIIRDRLGNDIAQHLTDAINDRLHTPTDHKNCEWQGECDYCMRQLEHHERVCRDAADELDSVTAYAGKSADALRRTIKQLRAEG